MDKTRAHGAASGFALAGTPGVLAGLALELMNPAFVDTPLTYWALAVAAPGLLGAAVGALVKAKRRVALEGLSAVWAFLIAILGFTDGVGQVDELKLVVVGIDGATWREIDPLVDGGELEHLAQVRSEGATGRMKAQEPLFSPLLWTTIAAGKGPDHHGVRGFRVHADDSRVPRFFDIAEVEGGHRIALYKWLVTWPPRELDHGGFIVPAWLAPSPETAPPELSFVKELELSRRLQRQKVAARRPAWRLAIAGMGEGLRFSTLLDAAMWQARERVFRPDEDAREVALNMLRAAIDRDVFLHQVQKTEPSIATFTYYPTDALGHRFWKYHEPEAFDDVDPVKLALYGDAVRDAYRQADAILGEVMEMMPADARLVVVSDHGLQALDIASLGDLASPRTGRLEERLNAEVGPIQVARVGTKVTIIPDCPPDAPPSCGTDVHDAVMTWVEALTQQSTGLPLYKWEPVPDDPTAVAVKLRQERLEPGALETDKVGDDPLSIWAKANEKWYSGDHSLHGIWGALGPDVTAGTRVDIDILDIAPTLLAAVGLGKGRDMQGSVPPGIWPAPPPVESWDGVRAKLRFPTEETSDDVNTEMLKALGYLDDDE